MARVYVELRLDPFLRSREGRFIELLAAVLIVGVLSQNSFATGLPSDRLLQAALGDHFTRYFCVSKFPVMRAQIQRAYDASRLSYIAVPCRGLTCSEAEYSKGMQALLSRSKSLSRTEARDVCAHYEDALKTLERDFAQELDALVHISRPGPNPAALRGGGDGNGQE